MILPDKNAQDDDKKHRICYPSKYEDKVFDIFSSRYKLYKTYYLNLKAGGIDLMLRDILKNSKKFLEFEEACQNLLKGEPKKYSLLTDSILERI